MKLILKWLENIGSKKFFVAIAALFTVLADKDPAQSWAVAVLAGIYIFAQALVDATKAKNGNGNNDVKRKMAYATSRKTSTPLPGDK